MAARGSDGAPGLAGATGPQGSNGATGSTGPAGANGAAATIAVGTTATIGSGNPATVTNIGTPVAAIFNFSTGKTTEIPASQFQAINPLLIVALAPTFSNLWTKLDAGRFKSSTPTKMAIGMILLGLGFVVLYMGQKLAIASGGKASSAWLAMVYLVHTLGELCLSPIGLSMVTKLAPPKVTSLAMGLWLFSSAVANYLAGILEALLTKVNIPIYLFLIGSSIGPALLLLALTPLLKKWMHGKA